MHEKEPQKHTWPRTHLREHVKSQTFLGACPQTPSHNLYCGPRFLYLPWTLHLLAAALGVTPSDVSQYLEARMYLKCAIGAVVTVVTVMLAGSFCEGKCHIMRSFMCMFQLACIISKGYCTCVPKYVIRVFTIWNCVSRQ